MPFVCRNSPKNICMQMSLPNEIIFQEILPNVPAKSLSRFSSVCKLWCNTMPHPFFISTHLRIRKSQQPGNIIPSSENDYAYSNAQTGERFDLHLNRILRDNNRLLPITSSDGLLVIQSVNTSNFRSVPLLYVCNPITGQFMKLPPAPFWFNVCEIAAYDRGYKVVSWSVRGCAIFTLGDGETGSWRMVGLPEGAGDIYSRAVLVNGSLNWVADTKNSDEACILSMKVSEEKIVEIKMPPFENCLARPILIEMKGYLYEVFSSSKNLDEMKIWVLDDWEKCLWTKVSKCDYSAMGEIVLRDRSRLHNGLLPLFNKDGSPYQIGHVNTLVRWNSDPFRHGKKMQRPTNSFQYLRSLLVSYFGW